MRAGGDFYTRPESHIVSGSRYFSLSKNMSGVACQAERSGNSAKCYNYDEKSTSHFTHFHKVQKKKRQMTAIEINLIVYIYQNETAKSKTGVSLSRCGRHPF